MAYSFEDHAAETPLRTVHGKLTRVECKRHPGRSIDHSAQACRGCGVYNGVAANFQVVTYDLVPASVRQCTDDDL